MTKKSSAYIKKTFHILSSIMFYIIVILCMLSLINRWIFKDTDQSIFGYRAVCVLSGSMEETLSVGDIVLIREEENYKKDDIISFREENTIITHRIIEITDDGFITKGDANNAVDSEVVKQKDIIGKKILIIPWIGYIRITLMSPVGLIIVMSICVVLYFAKRQIEEREEVTDEE